MLDPAQQQQLSNSIEVASFNWLQLAKYCFWFALFCVLIALFSALADKQIVALFEAIFNSQPLTKMVFFALLASVFFLFAQRTTQHRLRREALNVLGVFASITALAWLGVSWDLTLSQSIWFALPIWLAITGLGARLTSPLIWALGLLSGGKSGGGGKAGTPT